MLAIGTAMSYVFVFTLLPAILSFDERLKRAISIKRGKGDPDKGRLMYNPNYYNQDGTLLPEIIVADESAVVEEKIDAAEVDSSENVAQDEITSDVVNDTQNAENDNKPTEE